MRASALLLVAAMAGALMSCGEPQRLDQVERKPLPASVEEVRAAIVRTIAETGLARRLLADRDLPSDLRWHLAWIEDVRRMRVTFSELREWCATNTECTMGLKVVRPDLPPLSVPTTVQFIEAIGASPLFTYITRNAQWRDSEGARALSAASAVVERLLPLVARADRLDSAELRRLVADARSAREVLRTAAGTARVGAARSTVLGTIAAEVAQRMSKAADQLDPFWAVGAARIAQAASDLTAIGRRTKDAAEALERLAAELASDSELLGKLALRVDRMLYP
jgi:hypothetical protein